VFVVDTASQRLASKCSAGSVAARAHISPVFAG
jgi:hypothetical protein